MKITKRQLKRIIKEAILVEYGSGPEFDHLRSEKDNLTDQDMEAIANRFCDFLVRQEFPYTNFIRANYKKNDSTFSGGSETISVRANVYTGEWKRVRVEEEDMRGRKRVRYSERLVKFFEHGFRGINLSKLFAGTKYLQNMKPHLEHGQHGSSTSRYTFTMLLFWPKFDEPEERKLVYQELKEWLDANENKSFDRDDFGLPPIKQEFL